MLKLENVTYRYPGAESSALNGLNLEIRPGEALCLMGANGSGKSTLAKIIAGLVKLNRGRVSLDGADINERTSKQQVGILFQNPDNQMVAVTVEKEIAFALENQATAQNEMERRVTEALRTFGIEHLRRRLTSELSGGEKQLVALASIMIIHPRVLVLDEPDSFLDEPGKRNLRRELDALKKDSPDLIEIRITQYPQVAELYQRMVVIENGAVVADDIPANIFRDRSLCLRNGLTFDRNQAPPPIPKIWSVENHKDRLPRPDKLELDNVSFGYEDQFFLKDISLTLEAGETIGVVGPTGAGKSTLGQIICGLMPPRRGGLKFYDGNVIRSDRNRAGWVSGVFQQPERQFFLANCLEEVAFGPTNLGYDLTPEDIRSFFIMTGLNPDKFAGRDPFTLSVGEKRRLAFAAVLATLPGFIVFDEPTSALDREGVGRFIGLSRALKAKKTGQLIITHDGRIVRELADRILFLAGDGRHEIITTSELIQREQYNHLISSPTFDED
ncbi:MAG: ABC transporter ATP-binding protein [Candidatus Zixiibacteriota bacterium]